MIGLGKWWEGGLERGSCGLSGGYGEKSQGVRTALLGLSNTMVSTPRVPRMYSLKKKEINRENDKFVFLDKKGFYPVLLHTLKCFSFP